MLIYGLVAVLILSKALGGQFKHLAQLKLWGGWGLPLIALGQILSLIVRHSFAVLAAILMITSYLLLLLIAWMNRRLPPMPLILLGLSLNFLVITANAGTMPI